MPMMFVMQFGGVLEEDVGVLMNEFVIVDDMCDRS